MGILLIHNFSNTAEKLVSIKRKCAKGKIRNDLLRPLDIQFRSYTVHLYIQKFSINADNMHLRIFQGLKIST